MTGLIRSVGIEPEWTHHLRGGFISVLSAGTVLGACIASVLADKWGRKAAILITCFVFWLGSTTQMSAPTVDMFMLGRGISGTGVGLVSVLIPLYLAECGSAGGRGALVAVYQFAIAAGMLLGDTFVFLCRGLEAKTAYRIPLGMQFVWVAVLFAAILYFPDTPRNLIRMAQYGRALRATAKIYGLNVVEDRAIIEAELGAIRAALNHEMELGPGTLRQCFRGLDGRRTARGIGLQICQQRSPRRDISDNSHRGELHLLLRPNVL
jgi:MFS transporter, SP family, sugar:H+ symporter